MRLGLFLIIVGLVIVLPAFGQIGEGSLQALYGAQIDGKYVVNSEVSIETLDGANGGACVLFISGPTTKMELTGIVDMAVPASVRGSLKQDLINCDGACESVEDYEKVSISSGLFPGQTATPPAIVSFKAKSCEDRAKQASARGFAINRTM